MTPSLVTCAMQSDMQDYYDRLLYWQEHTDQTERDWAVFFCENQLAKSMNFEVAQALNPL